MTLRHEITKSNCIHCRSKLLVFRSTNFRDLLCVDCFREADWQEACQEADAIATWIGEQLTRRGVLVLQCKEKWGQPRVYCQLDRFSLWPIAPLFLWYSEIIYGRMYREALRRWPHREGIIRQGADHPELI